MLAGYPPLSNSLRPFCFADRQKYRKKAVCKPGSAFSDGFDNRS